MHNFKYIMINSQNKRWKRNIKGKYFVNLMYSYTFYIPTCKCSGVNTLENMMEVVLSFHFYMVLIWIQSNKCNLIQIVSHWQLIYHNGFSIYNIIFKMVNNCWYNSQQNDFYRFSFYTAVIFLENLVHSKIIKNFLVEWRCKFLAQTFVSRIFNYVNVQ